MKKFHTHHPLRSESCICTGKNLPMQKSEFACQERADLHASKKGCIFAPRLQSEGMVISQLWGRSFPTSAQKGMFHRTK